MNNYKLLNNTFGWITFAIAATVYMLTIEPTVSYWDCGEFIAAAYKLQVGHPPGAPLFMMIARLFTLMAGGDVTQVAKWVNTLSGLCNAFTILFLFWTITAFGKKIATVNGELTLTKIYAIIGSGLVGALGYTFTDSFWFSGVEGEVYAMSSFFTAIVFWMILKWESVANEKHSDRWLILIAYMMGLSIGVHLLNLLAIPALAYVYYFKKQRKPSFLGFLLAGVAGMGSLLVIQYGIIPGVVSLASRFELFFVNAMGMPFNTGLLVYAALLVGLIAFGLYYTQKKGFSIANTILLGITFILIGYSSYALIVIRSSANPPMDENDPSNVFALLAYLNREQYGDRPLVYGQYYNSPLAIDYEKRQYKYKDGKPVYYPGKKDGKDQYLIADDRKESIPVYDPEFCTVFPRMYSSQSNHIQAYKSWANIKGKTIKTDRPDVQEVVKPTWFENFKFFINYQVAHMYGRYFMWNFVGRQNNIQGHGNLTEGNWISGVDFIDSGRLVSQENLPDYLANNQARNKFYFLPLILGMIGLVFHFSRDARDGFVVFLLFFFTGLAIVIYLNQYPYQPRERDYAYAASFYAFSIWMGLAVYALYDFLAKKLSGTLSVGIATVSCLIAAPVVLARDGWDDHDRSGRYVVRDFARNYLESCAPNAILFTNGDNDTFPLWYAQDVEGIRTDVRVVNLSLLSTDWYINQMSRKAYESDRLPLTLTESKIRQGTRDFVPIVDKGIKDYVDIKKVIEFILSDVPNTKEDYGGKKIDFMPTKKIRIPVDSTFVANSGMLPESQNNKILSTLDWTLDKRYLLKNDLAVLDMLAHNDWKRPVYFAVTVGSDSYLDLDDHFQLEGLAYRLVPVKTINGDGHRGSVNTDVMYDNVMNKFKWGGMKNPDLYMDPETVRLTTGLRIHLSRLANALMQEGKTDSAIAVLDRAVEEMPNETVPYNFLVIPIAEAYYEAGADDKANAIVKTLSGIYERELNYYLNLSAGDIRRTQTEISEALSIMERTLDLALTYQQMDLADDIEKRYNAIKEEHLMDAGFP